MKKLWLLLVVLVFLVAVGIYIGHFVFPGVKPELAARSTSGPDQERGFESEPIQTARPEKKSSKTGIGPQGMSKNTNISHRGFDSFQNQQGSFLEIINVLGMRTNLIKPAEFLSIDLKQNAQVLVETGPQIQFVKIQLDDGRSFKFRCDLEELVVYMSSQVEDVPAELMHKDAVSVDTARSTVQELLSTLGLDEDMSRANYTLDYLGDPTDLADARWKFQLYQRYGEFLTNGFLQATVSAYSGDVIALSRMPLIIPENMEVRIAENDALQAAARFAKEIGLRVGEAAVADKWIQNSNPTIWAENREEMIGPDFSNPRPCYRVFAKDISTDGSESAGSEPARFYTLFVDCFSGEIIGGGGRRSGGLRPDLLDRLVFSEVTLK